MKKFLSKFLVKKNVYPEGYTPLQEYVVILIDRNGYGLSSELMSKYDLEQLILRNRDSIKYIFEYKDRVVVSNELVEIEEEKI